MRTNRFSVWFIDHSPYQRAAETVEIPETMPQNKSQEITCVKRNKWLHNGTGIRRSLKKFICLERSNIKFQNEHQLEESIACSMVASR